MVQLPRPPSPEREAAEQGWEAAPVFGTTQGEDVGAWLSMGKVLFMSLDRGPSLCFHPELKKWVF